MSKLDNQLAKAERFARFLYEHAPEFADSFTVGNLTTQEWSLITSWKNSVNEHQDKIPSFETRKLIISQLHVWETRPENVFSLFPQEGA